ARNTAELAGELALAPDEVEPAEVVLREVQGKETQAKETQGRLLPDA
ncbi:MAG: hypothetical protein RLZZ238_941, partial [Planctomycetota bacterium]